jgi:hypothetical protein
MKARMLLLVWDPRTYRDCSSCGTIKPNRAVSWHFN